MVKKRITLISLLLALALVLSACRAAPTPLAEPPEAFNLGMGEPKAVSVDGQTLLVIRTLEEANELWLVATDGSTSQKLFEFDLPTFHAAFSPDGEHLVWATDEIWLAKTDGSGQTSLLQSEAGFGPLAWSPDGHEIAFIEGDTIRAMDLTGSVRTIADTLESVRSLTWTTLSTGEERLFFNSFPAESPPFVASLDLATAEQRQLAQAEFFQVVGDELYLTEPIEEGKMWRASAVDGSSELALVESGVQGFAARPKVAGQLAVLQLTGEMQYDLSLINASGQRLQQLTVGSLAISPLWSPDGNTLYYALFDLEAADDVDDPFTVMKIDLSQ